MISTEFLIASVVLMGCSFLILYELDRTTSVQLIMNLMDSLPCLSGSLSRREGGLAPRMFDSLMSNIEISFSDNLSISNHAVWLSRS